MWWPAEKCHVEEGRSGLPRRTCGRYAGFLETTPGYEGFDEFFDHASTLQETAFRRTNHHPVCQLVYQLQAELERSGDHDGGPRHHADAGNDLWRRKPGTSSGK